MSRRRKRKTQPLQLAVLLLLLAALAALLLMQLRRAEREAPPEPTNAPSASPAPSPTPSASPAPSPTPSASPAPSPTPSAEPSPTPEPSPDARYSTGDEALDALLYAAVEEHTEPDMTDEEKLHALYQYVSGSFGYLRRNYYEPGETGWENAEALTMLSEGKGNCYNFAAAFCLLARCIGYDAEAYSGTVYGQATEGQTRPSRRPHGWVEINIDGTDYIFDPDMQATVAGWRYDDRFYMRDDAIRGQYGYKRGTEDGPEGESPPAAGEDAEEVTENP